MHRAQALLLVAACLATCGSASAPRHPEVLVVTNGESAISRAIGAAYAARRGVPTENVLALDLPLADPTLTTQDHHRIRREDFERLVRDPIAAHLRQHDPEGRIRILVTTKGVPLGIDDPASGGSAFSERRWASVDAELALLGSGRDGSTGMGSVPNPYLASDEPFADWRARNPEAPLRYLVARLSAYQTHPDASGIPRDVARLIDRAHAADGETPGEDDTAPLYAVDEDPAQNALLDAANRVMLGPAAASLRALGLRVRHDRSPAMLRDLEGLVGYASWGSNDRQSARAPFYGSIEGSRIPGSFARRSVAVDLVSTNARSFSEPTPYGQSLVADLLRMGAAGVAGHVFEPTLAGVVRPNLLLFYYARGVPAGEAYFRSVPYLGWTNVWIGDPLMEVARPAPAPADRDGDGTPDARDNCLWIPNPDQRDTNDDGFGNWCDPDLDGDGRVEAGGERLGDLGDLGRIERSRRTGLYVPDHDLDGDGEIDQRDLGIAQLYLHLPPGPSGRRPGSPKAPDGDQGPPPQGR